MLFISYCYECGLASSTIKSYIAGVSFAHKIRNCQDSTKHFVVKKILEGYSKVAQQPDARLPITCSVFAKICNGLSAICYNNYEAKLFKATYMLTYFALLKESVKLFLKQMHWQIAHY